MRIILLGYDMRLIDGKRHFFGAHPRGLEEPSPYDKFIRAFETAVPQLQQLGVEVVNCTPGSALHCFPQRPLAETL